MKKRDPYFILFNQITDCIFKLDAGSKTDDLKTANLCCSYTLSMRAKAQAEAEEAYLSMSE